MDELPAMGWACFYCQQPFEHGRYLVDHLLAEHEDVVEAGL